jgi:hypothetical protein
MHNLTKAAPNISIMLEGHLLPDAFHATLAFTTSDRPAAACRQPRGIQVVCPVG